MRIVHLVPNLNFGGLQAARLSLWLGEQGHEVTVTYWLGPNANQGAERDLTEAGVAVLGFRGDTVGRVASVRRLAARRPAVRLRFLDSGPIEDKLRRQARALGLDPIVTFLGSTHEVPACRAAWMSSSCHRRARACRSASLQAIASGRPVVATTVGGTTRIVDGADAGWLCPMTSTARSGPARPPGRIARGERAWQRVAVRHPVPRMAAEYQALYQRAFRTHAH